LFFFTVDGPSAGEITKGCSPREKIRGKQKFFVAGWGVKAVKKKNEIGSKSRLRAVDVKKKKNLRSILHYLWKNKGGAVTKFLGHRIRP